MGPGECPRGGESKNLSSTGTKGLTFRGATHIRRCRSLADGELAAGSPLSSRSDDQSHREALPPDRCCPVSLALCAGAYWRALEARGSVRWLTGPFSPS